MLERFEKEPSVFEVAYLDKEFGKEHETGGTKPA